VSPRAVRPNQPAPQLGRVLILDDDAAMREMIAAYLNSHNCPTVALSEPSAIRGHVESGGFSLIILDIHLGQKDGFDVLRQIREISDIPVIIITGERQDEIDRVVGLELGADDYLTKPFNLRELLARAKATLRRQEVGRLAIGSPQQRGGYRFRDWELRRKTRTLTDPQGDEVPLTKGEYALLVAFLDAPGRPLAREHLLRATRTHEDIFDRSIDVQVLRLRRKLDADPARPPMIRTERGVGYTFDAPVERLF
jgi:two-component system, OmpR family, response regulator